MATIKITKFRKQELEKELIIQKEDLKAAQERLVLAKEEGDLSENSGVDASKAEIALHENRIREIKEILDNSSIVADTSGPIIDIGSFVRVEKFNPNIGAYEEPVLYMIDSTPGMGVIALDAPLGKAIKGNTDGVTTIQTGMGDSITYRFRKDNSEGALQEFLLTYPSEINFDE